MSGTSVTWIPVPAPQGYLVNPYKQGDTMTESSNYESIQVFIGVDIGKDTHHAVAVNRSGKRLFDRALPNDENKLRALISDLKQHGQILLVVDQPATIGALPVAVARSEGVLILSDTFLDWQCDASPTCTPVKPKPMPVMRPSLPKLHVLCLMLFAL